MITVKQFTTFENLYEYYNRELFGGQLNDCLINMSRARKGVGGFFSPQEWKRRNKNFLKDIHEISLCPESLDSDDKLWQSILVHEMVHLWQEDYGSPSRGNYHNRQFAEKMETIGLICSKTGKPGGNKTGQGMSHYIDSSGRFLKAYKKLKESKIYNLTTYNHTTVVELGGAKKPAVDRSKTKYCCPSCGATVWGKPNLAIKCVNLGCDTFFEQF